MVEVIRVALTTSLVTVVVHVHAPSVAVQATEVVSAKYKDITSKIKEGEEGEEGEGEEEEENIYKAYLELM